MGCDARGARLEPAWCVRAGVSSQSAGGLDKTSQDRVQLFYISCVSQLPCREHWGINSRQQLGTTSPNRNISQPVIMFGPFHSYPDFPIYHRVNNQALYNRDTLQVCSLHKIDSFFLSFSLAPFL